MKTFIVDSFTDQAFKGNPAGVCLVSAKLDEELMQAIAKELNLSETAFIQEQKDGSYSIRYFSPVMEIPLCGHATLAASKILFRDPQTDSISFRTKDGLELNIARTDEDIAMTFPVYGLEPGTVSSEFLSALGLSAVTYVGFNRETNIIVLEVESTDVLARLAPDFRALLNSIDTIDGVSVTAASKDGLHDFHSRFFWPWSGGDEDPVTGATHTFLAKYWGDKLDKTKMRSFQASARTGEMELELLNGKLTITGQAVIVFEGELKV